MEDDRAKTKANGRRADGKDALGRFRRPSHEEPETENGGEEEEVHIMSRNLGAGCLKITERLTLLSDACAVASTSSAVPSVLRQREKRCRFGRVWGRRLRRKTLAMKSMLVGESLPSY